jgi:hypothetical protein
MGTKVCEWLEMAYIFSFNSGGDGSNTASQAVLAQQSPAKKMTFE